MNNCEIENCILPLYEDNEQCILHCEKDNFTDDMDFVISFESYAKNLTAGNLILSKIHFPSTISSEDSEHNCILDYLPGGNLKVIKFYDCHFYCDTFYTNKQRIQAYFMACEFHNSWILNEEIKSVQEDLSIYDRCIFHDDVSTRYIDNINNRTIYHTIQFGVICNFKGKVELNNAIFEKPLFVDKKNYEPSLIKELSICNCMFKDVLNINNYQVTKININGLICQNKVSLVKNKIDTIAIKDANFDKLFMFYRNECKKCNIEVSKFSKLAVFDKCEFCKTEEKEPVMFEYVTFEGMVNFRNTKFDNGLDISRVNWADDVNFVNTTIASDNTNRETFRIVKNSLDKVSNHLDANKFYAQEMIKYKEELSSDSRLTQEKFIFWINFWVSNFGQSYIRPILWILGFLVLYAGLLRVPTRWIAEKLHICEQTQPLAYVIYDFPAKLVKDLPILGEYLKDAHEFISLIFYIIFSVLIWQTIVAFKRHTKR